MECKLSFLRKNLQDNFERLDASSYLEQSDKQSSFTKVDAMDVELVFRGFLEEITSQASVTEVR